MGLFQQPVKTSLDDTGFGFWGLVFVLLVLAGGVAFLIGLSGPSPERAWGIFLINYLFWSGLAFGSVLFSATLVITKARWGRPVKRLAEASSAFLPFSFLLFWVIFLGRDKIFPWIQHPIPQKAAWLNAPFLFVRNGLGLLALTAASLALVYFSVRGERNIPSGGQETWLNYQAQGEANLRGQAFLSPIVAILYAVVFSLFGFDLVMSLSPEWYSTLFGMYFFTGAFYCALAALIILSGIAVRRFGMGEYIQKNQFHDLGKLLLAFCLVNGDFFFAQFLVIWYGNLPEETRFVILRVNVYPWNVLAWTVLFLFFILPFVVLLSRKVKMKPTLMTVLAGLILAGLWLERFLVITPSLWKGRGLPLGWQELMVSLGFLGLLGLCLQWFIRRFPLLPLSDPLFLESLDASAVKDLK